MPEQRVETAEAFLQEAVFRSRARQAASTALRAPAAGTAGCGLGRGPEAELDLSPRGEQLFAALWPHGLSPQAFPTLRERMLAWIEEQDAIDRRRNHFLRDFRGRHGPDRRTWTAEQAEAFRSGLEVLHAEESRRRREAAACLPPGS